MPDNQLTDKELQVQEDKEIAELLENSNYYLTPKFRKWMDLYNDEDSPTFGNATQSAIKAYKLDPDKQYNSAGIIGHENLKKLKIVAFDYAQRKGYTLQKVIDILRVKMVKTNNPGYIDRFLDITGLKEMQESPPATQNTQINIFNTKEEDQKSIHQKLQSFLEDHA